MRKDERNAPPECLDKVKESISKARQIKVEAKRKHRMKITMKVLTFCLCFAIVLPNISPDFAQAMSSMPVIGSFFEAVVFRNYNYEDERFKADVTVPRIITQGEIAENSEISKDGIASVNSKIDEISEKVVSEFTDNLKLGQGHFDIYVNYEVLNTTDEYFVLKLITYRGGGSGFEEDYYYVLSIPEGKEMTLADFFPKGADYVNPISNNIIEQMRKEMQQDKNRSYWVDMDENDFGKSWEFKAIKPEQQFYIDSDGSIVIAFNEGEVAPMYMGCVTFTIPKEITEAIKKIDFKYQLNIKDKTK